MLHRHRMPPFQQVSLSNFCPAIAALVNCKYCYCEVETSRSNNGSAVVHKNCPSSVATLTAEFQTASASNVNTIAICWELHEMGCHGLSLRSPCAMPGVGWSGVKLAAIGHWSSGNAFSGVMNHASLFVNPMDESGFGGCQENATCPNA